MVEEEFVEKIPQEGSFDLEIAKQVFKDEKKKMRMVSRKQQEEIERWREEAEMQEDRLRKMSPNYETSKKNYQQLNEDMVKLERKFKYAGLRTSLGLPQDEQERMQRELNMWKHQAEEAQKKVTQLESANRAKDARHFEKMEKMKATIRNERVGIWK